MATDPRYGTADWKRMRKAVLERDGYRCVIRGPKCKGHATTVDHIVPLSRGGPHLAPSNLRASCASCQTWATWATRRLIAAQRAEVEYQPSARWLDPEPRSRWW